MNKVKLIPTKVVLTKLKRKAQEYVWETGADPAPFKRMQEWLEARE